MVEVDSDADDLWDFSTPGGAQPIPHSDNDSEEDDDDDDLKALPASKRRKLQKRMIVVPDLVVLEDSSEDEEPDPDLEIYEEAKRKHKAEQAEKENDIVFLDMTTVVPVISSRLSETYEATQAEIQRNLERLEEVKNMLHAPTPEQPDNRETLRDRQPIEDVREEVVDQPDPELDKIIVKVKAKAQEQSVKLRIGKQQELERLFLAFRKRAEESEWIDGTTPMTFIFDGEVIRPTDTAEDLEIEEDCVIEAHWQA